MIAGFALAACVGLERQDPPERGRGDGDAGPAPTEPPSAACYAGPEEDFAVCLPLIDVAWPAEDYVYPPPLDGSPQYSAPVAFLDLAEADPFTAIAPNFLLGETADAAFGGYAVVQVHAVVALQAVRDRVGALMVTSGYRSPAHNADIDGATWSRHLYGDAFDLAPLYVTLEDLAEACWDEGASYVEQYATHVHCDWRDDPLDPAFFGE